MKLLEFMMKYNVAPKRQSDKMLWNKNKDKDLTAYLIVKDNKWLQMYVLLFTDNKGTEQAFMNGMRIPVPYAIMAIRSAKLTKLVERKLY